MESHVKIIGILYIVSGALGILCAVGALAFGGVVFAILVSQGEGPEAQIAVAAISSIIAALVFVLSIPNIIAGVYLMKFRNWARILCIVLSVLNLPSFPIGTALGVYALVILLNKETEVLFQSKRA